MSTDKTFTTYKASIDPSFLQKVDRLFDASPQTVWYELLQNARRAGAKTVSVCFERYPDRTAVTFADNGRGLDEPMSLLRLAASQWEGADVEDEDPAGMGFFCLANFESVYARSRNWSIHLDQASFRGEKEIVVIPVEEEQKGMTLVWEWEQVSYETLLGALQKAASFCGLHDVYIYLGGELVHQTKPTSFLWDCETVHEYPELGVRIGLMCSNSNITGHPVVCTNFHGIVLSGPDVDVFSSLDWARLTIKVDVLHAKTLRLVLPARNALKHSTARSKLMDVCEELAYRWCLEKWGKGQHEVPWAVYKRAKDKFGIDLGEAKNSLSAHLPCQVNSPDTLGKFCLVPWSYHEWVQMTQALQFYNQANEPKDQLVVLETQPSMAGYSWYDALPMLEETLIEIDGKVMTVEDFTFQKSDDTEDDEEGLPIHYADSLSVTFVLSDKTRHKSSVPFLVSGADRSNYFATFAESVAVATRLYLPKTMQPDVSSTADIVRTASLLTDCLFEVSFDTGDGHEQQENMFSRDILAWLLERCGSRKRALESLLKAGLSECRTDVKSPDLCWTVRFDGRRYGECSFAKVVSFQFAKEEEHNHKLLCASPRGNSDWIEEIVSQRPVTHGRIEVYLRKQHGFGDEDGWVLDSVGPVVDLDKWEAENPEPQEVQHGNE